MPHIRRFVFALFTMWSATAFGQTLRVGSLGTPVGDFGPGPVTVVDKSRAARESGSVTAATFRWSQWPCLATVKIKFFHFVFPIASHGFTATFLGERGPFDVFQPIQTVPLIPPVPIRSGDAIGIAGISGCGSPVSGNESMESWVAPGDLRTDFGQNPATDLSHSHAIVEATDDSLSLLNSRFKVSLTATDPRTGRATVGRGISQGDRYGYFSLPEFTGDPGFPEVIVKMADATASPPPFGGSFWFFYSPLTDVQYSLTVTDQLKGATRTYSNIPGGSGQLCGGADTDAFRP
jgi:hypothetical protein